MQYNSGFRLGIFERRHHDDTSFIIGFILINSNNNNIFLLFSYTIHTAIRWSFIFSVRTADFIL